MSFADLKAQARRNVHAAFAVRCLYTPPNSPSNQLPVELTARLHTKIVAGGAQSPGYANVIEGVNRAIFNREELTAKTVVLRKNGRIEFPDYTMVFQLDIRDASDGAITEKWSLASL